MNLEATFDQQEVGAAKGQASNLPREKSVRRAARSTAATVLDILERLLVVALYGWLVARILLSFTARGAAINALLLASEGLVVFFILIRRRSNGISRNPLDWLMAFFATSMPLLVSPKAAATAIHPSLGTAAVAGLMIGILLQVSAKICLGRSFGLVPAHRGLKLSGPYRLVRHPMYAGYLLTHVAFLMINPTLWNFIVYTICYSLQVPRLLAEERLLSDDPSYRSYIDTVRYRLVPGIF